jgi:hypothetical protein
MAALKDNTSSPCAVAYHNFIFSSAVAKARGAKKPTLRAVFGNSLRMSLTGSDFSQGEFCLRFAQGFQLPSAITDNIELWKSEITLLHVVAFNGFMSQEALFEVMADRRISRKSVADANYRESVDHEIDAEADERGEKQYQKDKRISINA